MNSHRGVEPHMCDQEGCAYRSSDRSNLAKHRVNVHKLARRGKARTRGTARFTGHTRAVMHPDVRVVAVASSAPSSNPDDPPVNEEVEVATVPSRLDQDPFGHVFRAVRDMVNVQRCPFCSSYAAGSIYGIANHIAENHPDITTIILSNGHY